MTAVNKDNQDKKDIIASVANDYYEQLKNKAPYINMKFEELGVVCRDFATRDVEAAITTQLTSLIEKVETEVIGEDEPTKRPAPDFLLGDVYGVERNELRAEQRQALATIKQELIEGSK